MSDQITQEKIPWLKSVVQGCCPRCRVGKMFKFSLFSLKFGQMHESCPECKQDFKIEPGFYIGSTYVGYAFSVIISMTIIISYLTWFSHLKLWVPVVVATSIAVLFAPVNFRLSRVLMLHLFGGVKYGG